LASSLRSGVLYSRAELACSQREEPEQPRRCI